MLQPFEVFYHIPRSTWRKCYERGYRPARYPLPAIRREYEFGQDCQTGEVVLFCREYGSYEERL